MRSLLNAGCENDVLVAFLLRDARKQVTGYLHSQQTANGDFYGRDHRPDLYYTMFGLACLTMLDAERPNAKCLHSLPSDPDSLDAVHLHCLLRCQLLLGESRTAKALLPRVEQFRSRDGAYSRLPAADNGDAYATFLAVQAYRSLGLTTPRPTAAVDALYDMMSADGSFWKDMQAKSGNCTTTAAAVSALAGLGSEVPSASVEWLQKSFLDSGGARWSTQTPMADLLSTATALDALNAADAAIPQLIQTTSLDFVEDLWQANGGFAATTDSDQTDVEYTFYGLLALKRLLPDPTATTESVDA